MADTQYGEQDEVRGLLMAWRAGDEAARDKLFTLLYSELRQVSAALLRAERNSSLSTGDLVNEAVMRLIRMDRIEWSDKTHFLALSARAMRRILIDNARRKSSDKRHHHKVTLVTRIGGAAADRIDFDILEKALIRLSAIDKAKADIVELRYFAGMTHEEIAEVTGTSEATVKRGWRAARAWLLDALTADKQVRDAPG
ncbi:MAG: sigma-70 family RNA polymerase sigma factor [Hyphomonas sp.]|nr:sigma-70 family RNA polymerase sigma factor [Hyphomonas sp.]